MRHWVARSTARCVIDSGTGERWLAEASCIVGMIHGLIRHRQANPMQARETPKEYDAFSEEE